MRIQSPIRIKLHRVCGWTKLHSPLTDVEDEGEATLNLFGAQLESLAGNCALQPCPIVVDGPASRVVAVPAGKSLLLFLGDTAFPGAVLQVLQHIAGMIALVGDHLGRSL